MRVRDVAERLSRGVVLRRRLPADVGGMAIYVTPDSRLGYWRRAIGLVDDGLICLAKEIVTPGAVVWDVGANVGLFTFAAAGLALGGQVLAIEPDWWLASLLRRSARTSDKRSARVDVLCSAVSDRAGVSEFSIAERGRSANHLLGFGSTQTGGSRERLYVPTVTLDLLTRDFPGPTVLKIDVEGAEDLVLSGSVSLLQEFKPIILCEVSARCTRGVTERLLAAGYELFDADLPPSRRIPSPVATWNTLARQQNPFAARAVSFTRF